ncbi:hypothetical protein CFAEC_12920 [Corynebacterium faecale]|nr:hypothetical protein CFAEC_12920 [Corynebacterium faecale]
MNACNVLVMLFSDLDHWNSSLQNTETPFKLHLNPHNTDVDGQEQQGFILRKIMLELTEEASSSAAQPRPLRAMMIKDPQELRNLLKHISRHVGREDLIILVPTITPRIADDLRRNRIMFADERGNAFVAWPGVYIDIRGRIGNTETLRRNDRPDAGVSKAPRTASLFTPRRAQVSALLLSRPELLNKSVRDIARESGVSVGTAKQTLDLLREAGYLRVSSPGHYRMENVESFLDAWAHAYPTGLGTSQQIFRGTGGIDRLRSLEPLGWISGEQAVPELVQGGNTAHLYVDGVEESRKIIGAARLRQDDHGEVMIRSSFWLPLMNHQAEKNETLRSSKVESVFELWPRAPRAVIYADLLSVNDPRLAEIAGKIKEELINGQF